MEGALGENRLALLAAQTPCGVLRKVIGDSHTGNLDDPFFDIESEDSFSGKGEDKFSSCQAHLYICRSANDEDPPELYPVFTMVRKGSENKFDTVIGISLEELLAGKVVSVCGSEFHNIAV